MMRELTKYFYYTKSERNGVLILLSLCLCVLVLSKSGLMTQKVKTEPDFASFEAEFAVLENTFGQNTAFTADKKIGKATRFFAFDPNDVSHTELLELGLSERVATIWQNFRAKGGRFFKNDDVKKIYGLSEADYVQLEPFISIQKTSPTATTAPDFWQKDLSQTPVEIKRFLFDPNTASEIELLTLGLEQKVVKNIIKYRQSGGKFYKKEDLKKIYGFSDIDFLRLSDFIQIIDFQKNTNTNDVATNTQTEQKTNGKLPLSIDLNRATAAELLQLRGIGATFATRIIEQREKLGGFASLSQVKDIHGLPDSTYYSIAQNLKLATSVYRKIPINKITVENFTHPYLTRKQVQSIVRFKMNHGDFKNMSDLQNSAVLSATDIEKLKPYVVFE